MTESKSLIAQPVEPEYKLLVNNISTLWEEAKKESRFVSKFRTLDGKLAYRSVYC